MLTMWKEKFASAFTAHPILEQEAIINEAGDVSRAMTLFKQSKLEGSLVDLKKFTVLAEVLANPLCQTIYDARLRVFSDYSKPSEPVDSSFAANLINRLYKAKTDDNKVAIFFDALLSIRPFPPSQKYMSYRDVSDTVLSELNMYCISMIERIHNSEDYERTQCMIASLQTVGGNEDIFNQLKYSIATTIVSEDLYSERLHDHLMEDIRCELFKPQTGLSSFTHELNSSKEETGFQPSAAATAQEDTSTLSAFAVSKPKGGFFPKERDHITAVDRYSIRSGMISSAAAHTLGFFDQTTSSTKRKRTADADEPTASAATSKHSR